MSSEESETTSASSRIRQFGLYRTIDARTEEFLRQSRKRQIKQGCACAAISTAITVTVVITVFLVYMEHGMASESNKPTLGKTSWIGLMNDSLTSALEEKFSKSKLNFDRTTIKLLPLLIKALKQNRYLEKIIEDYSSSSPVYEGKMTTEYTIKKDVFRNSKPWLKKPSTKIHSLDQKLAPAYLKKLNKNLARFTKTRKIRDYKRLLQFLDKIKMINNKNIDHNPPTSTSERNVQKPTQKPKKHVPKVVKNKFKAHHSIKAHPKISKSSPKSKVKHSKSNESVCCKCPKQLGVLLNKIVSSIQQLIDTNSNNTTPCQSQRESIVPKETNNKRTTITTQSTTTITPTKIKPRTTKTQTTSSTKGPTTTKHWHELSNLRRDSGPYPDLRISEFGNLYRKDDKPNKKMAKSLEFGNIFEENYATLASSNIEPIADQQIHTGLDRYKKSEEIRVDSTTIKEYIEPTEANVLITATKPMTPVIAAIEREPPVIIITSEKYIPLYPDLKEQLVDQELLSMTSDQKTDNAISINIINNITRPLFSIDNDEYYSSKTAERMSKFDIYNLKLLKNKSSLLSTEYITTTDNVNTKSSAFLTSVNDSEALVFTDIPPTEQYTTEGSSFSSTTIKEEKMIEETATLIEDQMLSTADTKSHLNYTYKPNSILNKEKKQYIQNQNIDNTNQDDDFYKVTRDEEYNDEYNVKPTENLVSFTNSLLNNTVIKEITTKIEKEDLWKILKINEHNKINSMIPENRPTYLEVSRNGWRRDENEDYDLNIRSNNYDLV